MKRSLFYSISIAVLIIVILSILSYLNIIPLKSFFINFKSPNSPTTQNNTQNEIKINQKAKPVGIQCPVSYDLCQKGISLLDKGEPLLLFDIPVGTKLLSVGHLTSLTTESIKIDEKQVQATYAPFTYNETCYLATYILPDKVSIAYINGFPTEKGVVIGEAHDKEETFNGKSYRLLMKLQMNKDTGSNCTITNKSPKQFGEFVNIKTDMFD